MDLLMVADPNVRLCTRDARKKYLLRELELDMIPHENRGNRRFYQTQDIISYVRTQIGEDQWMRRCKTAEYRSMRKHERDGLLREMPPLVQEMMQSRTPPPTEWADLAALYAQFCRHPTPELRITFLETMKATLLTVPMPRRPPTRDASPGRREKQDRYADLKQALDAYGLGTRIMERPCRRYVLRNKGTIDDVIDALMLEFPRTA